MSGGSSSTYSKSIVADRMFMMSTMMPSENLMVPLTGSMSIMVNGGQGRCTARSVTPVRLDRRENRSASEQTRPPSYD